MRIAICLIILILANGCAALPSNSPAYQESKRIVEHIDIIQEERVELPPIKVQKNYSSFYLSKSNFIYTAGVPIDRFLVKNGYKVTGIDFARNMLKAAKKNVPRARYIQMDMTKMKFRPDSFDVAVSFYAIIHVPKEKHAKLYKDLHKILKSDGIILVNASGHKKWEGYGDFIDTRMFWSHYAPAKTSGILKKSGFKILWHRVLELGGEALREQRFSTGALLRGRDILGGGHCVLDGV